MQSELSEQNTISKIPTKFRAFDNIHGVRIVNIRIDDPKPISRILRNPDIFENMMTKIQLDCWNISEKK